MTSSTACCTCASLLTSPTATKSFTEKPPRPATPPSYQLLPCCGRAICDACIERNPRFSSYCPFCQISTAPSALPQGLRDPPAYDPAPDSHREEEPFSLQRESHGTGDEDKPPEYSVHDRGAGSQSDQEAPDVTHHLHPTDTVQSLSLAYAIPTPVLRNHNNLFNDQLLQARRTFIIPGSHYKGGLSLSPNPVEGEEERERKAKVRRFMVQSKCHQYDMAEVYLINAKGDVEGAVLRWKEDERWEKENPMRASGKGKVGRRKDASGGLTGQMS